MGLTPDRKFSAAVSDYVIRQLYFEAVLKDSTGCAAFEEDNLVGLDLARQVEEG
jgi:hypothetical protein